MHVSSRGFLPDWLGVLERTGIEAEAWKSEAMFISSIETTRRIVGYCSMTMLGAELTGVTAKVGMLVGERKLSDWGGGGVCEARPEEEDGVDRRLIVPGDGWDLCRINWVVVDCGNCKYVVVVVVAVWVRGRMSVSVSVLEGDLHSWKTIKSIGDLM